MRSVFFSPWVGEDYSKNGYRNKRLLILGESHYCRESCEFCGDSSLLQQCDHFTSDVLEGYLSYKQGKAKFEKWMATFTRFANVFLGDGVNNDSVIKFWNSVVFYNYIQKSISGPRVAPTRDDFINSSDAFFEILNMHKPELVIVWGKRLWGNLPKIGTLGDETFTINGEKFFFYKVGTVHIPAFYVCHPSSRYFSYESSYSFTKALSIV